MKRQPSYLVFAFIWTVTFISCDPCRNLDCISNRDFGHFRIVSKIDGKDLVFGPNATYDRTKIQFYTLNGTDTTFLYYMPTRFSGTGHDSVLFVKFDPRTPTPAFIKLTNSDRDTLSLTYKTVNTECCGTISDVTNFRYNNSVDIPGNEQVQVIRK